MQIETLQLGQSQENVNALVKLKLTKYSPEKVVMTDHALELIKKNQELAPGKFEEFRAKCIGVVVGGALPLAITGIFSLTLYKLYQTGTLSYLLQKIQTAVSAVATKAFAAMTANKATLAATTGGAALATFALTRPATKEAMGSFFGSLFGSFTGAGLMQFFKDSQSAGYHWWYDKYQFPERLKAIESNKEAMVTFLTDTYNDMSKYLEESLEKQEHQTNSLQHLHEIAKTLKEKLPTIHVIFQKQGISYNQSTEITLQFEKAIGIVLAETTTKHK